MSPSFFCACQILYIMIVHATDIKLTVYPNSVELSAVRQSVDGLSVCFPSGLRVSQH